MAKVIKIKNPPLPDGEETFLTTKYTAGTALTVRNNDGWANGDIAVVGHPGDEKTEAVVVTGVTNASQIDILAALSFDHPADTPIFKARNNQISLEQKPSGGVYAEIAEGKKAIQWDEADGFTKITVALGADGDIFKWRFYNTRLTTYSGYSGELLGTGLTPQHAGFIIAKIRKFAKIPANLGITDKDILDILNNGQRDVDTQYAKWWFTLTEDSDATRKQAAAGTYKYDLPTYFRAMDVVKCLDTNDQLYNLKYIPNIEFDLRICDQSTTARDDSSRNWTILPPDTSNAYGYFGIYPIPETTTNYFYRRYWRYLPELTSFASTTLIPYPDTLYNWGMYEVKTLQGDKDASEMYYKRYLGNIAKLRQLQRRQMGQPEFMRFNGQMGFHGLFGQPVSTGDTRRENYW